MEYLIVSFTHKNTNIGTREKLAFGNDLEKKLFLKQVIDCNYINAAILTSTCNRVEVVASVIDIQKAIKTILEQLNKKSKISIDELENTVDIYENENAVRHIFTVVSSLDSLVVGETQIAGQFKDAFKFSQDHNFTNQKLIRLVNYAFKCAKEVRNATSLGTGSTSVASAAVAKAKEICNTDTKALVIGAGEMSELTIRTFLRDKFKVILVSRNINKARLLAQEIINSSNSYDTSMIDVQPYDELPLLLNTQRLLVTATSAPYPIITNDIVRDVNFKRIWFDIAIPRDINISNIPNVDIYAVDDLKDIVNRNLSTRAQEAKEAYFIIKQMTSNFYKWLTNLGVEPVIKQIYLNAQDIIDKKVNIAISKKFIKDDDKRNITKLCNTVINEFLHQTSISLRGSSGEIGNDRLVNLVKLLYGIRNIDDLKDIQECKDK